MNSIVFVQTTNNILIFEIIFHIIFSLSDVYIWHIRIHIYIYMQIKLGIICFSYSVIKRNSHIFGTYWFFCSPSLHMYLYFRIYLKSGVHVSSIQRYMLSVDSLLSHLPLYFLLYLYFRIYLVSKLHVSDLKYEGVMYLT